MSRLLIQMGLIVLSISAAFAIGAAPQEHIVLNANNVTSIRGEVSDASVDKVLFDIAKSDASKPYYLYLETPGGSVFAGRRLVTYLNSTPRNIVCIGNTAISMGFIIFQACKTRLVVDQSVLMSHQISNKIEGSLDTMKSQLVMSEKLSLLYDTNTSRRMGLTLQEFRARMNPEWWLMGFEEILNNKAADRLAIVSCTEQFEKVLEGIPTSSGVIWISKCPIM